MDPLHLVTTGAESSGKTTLAKQLSQRLDAPLVSEASRPYLNAMRCADSRFRYQLDDLLAIAKLQLGAERRATSDKPPCIICDTDLLVIKVWCEEKFGFCHPLIDRLFTEQLQAAPRHYLLCHWDIPWEADPLRENPDDREYLYGRYLEVLNSLDVPYSIVRGSPDERLEKAIRAGTGAART